MDHDPDRGQPEAALRVEIVDLRAENVRLRQLRAEDRRFAARKQLELTVTLSKGSDRARLDEQIAGLQKTLADEGAFIDRLVVYLRRRATEGESP